MAYIPRRTAGKSHPGDSPCQNKLPFSLPCRILLYWQSSDTGKRPLVLYPRVIAAPETPALPAYFLSESGIIH